MTKKPPLYSFSRLDLFGRCPFAFQKIYVEKIPRAVLINKILCALLVGNRLPDVMNRYLRR